ncbi:MAG: ketopantoate reductase family protein [Terriglobales bacterium]
MDIAVIGAGGVGGYYGGLLARAGNRVTMLARREHLSALRTRGLEVHMPDEHFVVSVGAVAKPEELVGAELAIVAVKSYSLAEVAPAISRVANSGSIVLPLLNGVDTVEQLVKFHIPEKQIVAGLTTISVFKVAPGVIERRSSFARVAVGEPRGGLSQRAQRIADTFVQAGIDASASANITVELWRKFAFIATLAAACGLSRTSIGPLRTAPLGGLLLERSVREIVSIGKARGVGLSETDVQQTLATIRGLAPQMKPSFLVDLERGGPTELDILSGAVSRMGRELNIETPVHDSATAALAAASGIVSA